jgi:hypothetical protein
VRKYRDRRHRYAWLFRFLRVLLLGAVAVAAAPVTIAAGCAAAAAWLADGRRGGCMPLRCAARRWSPPG